MSRTVRFSPKARADLDEIWDYSARVWGERQAETYLRSIHAAASFVAEYPGAARSADRVRPGVSKYVVESHVLYMRIHRDRVDITRVLHKSMDASRHL